MEIQRTRDDLRQITISQYFNPLIPFNNAKYIFTSTVPRVFQSFFKTNSHFHSPSPGFPPPPDAAVHHMMERARIGQPCPSHKSSLPEQSHKVKHRPQFLLESSTVPHSSPTFKQIQWFYQLDFWNLET